ncbi:hypothetical protein [Oerskovia turbata]|nr:hypothetical protein [Oerskovia turbata]
MPAASGEGLVLVAGGVIPWSYAPGRAGTPRVEQGRVGSPSGAW